MGKLRQRLLFLVRRHRFHRELEEEMRLHLEMQAEEQIEAGMPPEQAQAAARRRFGNALYLREASREIWGLGWLETFLQDLRYGIRTLRRNPGFTAVAVLSLVLGIGANTAIFSLINGVMLKMLPVEEPKELVFLQKVSPRETDPLFSYPVFNRLRESQGVFSELCAFTQVNGIPVRLPASGTDVRRETANGQLVSGNFFSALGVQAIIGRTLAPEDDQIPGGQPVAVISHGYWKRRFAASPSVVGQILTANDTALTIIGVTPPEFFGVTVGRPADIWIPATMQAPIRYSSNYHSSWDANSRRPWLSQINICWVQLLGRLKRGVSPAQARAAADVSFQQSAAAGYREAVKFRIELAPGEKGLSELRRAYSEPLWILMTIVGLVLLIACANIANLLLARAAARQREIGVRLAIGAGRGRLIRQLLTESALLAVLGGALGLLVAHWSKDLLLTLAGPRLLSVDTSLDHRVLGFTLALSLATGILFGLAPAMQATSSQIGMAASQRRFRGSRELAAAQVALSTFLLVGAGLLLKNLWNLRRLDTGYRPEGLLMVFIEPGPLNYQGPQLADLYRRLLERVAAIPGVQSAVLSLAPPLSTSSWMGNVTVAGYSPQPEENQDVMRMTVTPGFFEAVGIRFIEGRGFTEQDSASASRVAVINETMARYFFRGRSALGQRFDFGSRLNGAGTEIVGVVRDAKYNNLKAKTPRMAYLPASQRVEPLQSLSVRVMPGSAKTVASQLRPVINEVDRNLRVGEVLTISEQVERLVAGERSMATLSTFFGLLALFLASIGVYGMLSYGVARRTREIGIRMALGARRIEVVWLIVYEALGISAIGIVIGLLAAAASARMTQSMLHEISPRDPVALSVAAFVMLLVAVLAASLPARKASRIDPMQALRNE